MLIGITEESESGNSLKAGTTIERVSPGRKTDEYGEMAANAKKKTAPKKIKHVIEPSVLDNADIERLSNELIEHRNKNEQEQLNAKLIAHRSAARLDHTINGSTPERSQAIRSSHQKLLDLYAQKNRDLNTKPSAAQMKAGQEVNRLELAKLNEQGGKYNPGDKKAIQRPSKGFTLEALQQTNDWDKLDPASRNKAEIVMNAARNDGKVIIEYDAERSGDTHQFKLKTVSPLSLDIAGDDEHPALIMYATNENGHTGMYYLSQSKANEKTGTVSYTHEITPLPEKNGKARLGLDANAYQGQREVNVSEILTRPIRKTAGLTSETEAMTVEGNKGRDVHEIRAELKKQAKKKGSKSKAAKAAKIIDEMAESSTVVQDAIEKASKGKAAAKDGDSVAKQMSKAKGKNREKLADDSGC